MDKTAWRAMHAFPGSIARTRSLARRSKRNFYSGLGAARSTEPMPPHAGMQNARPLTTRVARFLSTL
jgi:hypothetical protein